MGTNPIRRWTDILAGPRPHIFETMPKIHKDCPFTKEEMDAIKAELYYVNSTNHCVNPPHPSWYRGLNDWQVKQQEL
jgi:hypothetical protein